MVGGEREREIKINTTVNLYVRQSRCIITVDLKGEHTMYMYMYTQHIQLD